MLSMRYKKIFLILVFYGESVLVFTVMGSSLVINRLPLFDRRVIRLLTGAKLQHLNVKNEKIPFILF